MNQYCFGVDLGGTTIKIGLFGEDDIPIRTWEIPTRKEQNGAYILGDIRQAMSQEMIERGIAPDQILGVGIAVPGPVTSDGVVHRCVNLGWENVDVAKELSSQFYNLMVKVGNDANVAALGEAWFGSGKGYKNMVMLTLGTGLGGGIILNGRILPGSHGAGGEVGHAPMYPQAKTPCNCGNTGCLEQIASATGIVRKAVEVLAESSVESELRGKEKLSAKDVMDACRRGDPAAEETVRVLVDTLARSMAVFAVVVDPEAFVIGGGVSKTGQWFIDRLKARYDDYAFHSCRATEIRLAALGNDAGMHGAAAMILSEH